MKFFLTNLYLKKIQRKVFFITKHGFSNKERLYRIWRNMRRRCNSPKSDYYYNYGGRGIKVCDEWDDYLNFRKWALRNGYSEELSIDRINVDGNYEPSNCRWATREEQANNARSNVNLTYKGVTKTATEWARTLGITKSTMFHRLDRSWTIEEIMTIPMGGRRTKESPKAKVYLYNGKFKTLKQLSKIKGIHPDTIRHRIKIGMKIEEAATKPLSKNQFA